MRKTLLTLLACAMFWAVSGQSPLFYAYGNIASITTNGAFKNVEISGFVGGYGQYPDANFEETDIPTNPTDYVFWSSCTRFVVVEKISSFPLVLKVSDVNGSLASGDLDNSRIAILQESRVGSLNIGAVPNVADGNAGALAGVSPFEFACMQNYYKTQTAEAITGLAYVAGDGIDITGQTITSTVSSKEESFTATSGQIAFTLSNSVPPPSGPTLPISVFRNGTKLEYAASAPNILQFSYSGTTVTTAANQTNDQIIIRYVIFE